MKTLRSTSSSTKDGGRRGGSCTSGWMRSRSIPTQLVRDDEVMNQGSKVRQEEYQFQLIIIIIEILFFLSFFLLKYLETMLEKNSWFFSRVVCFGLCECVRDGIHGEGLKRPEDKGGERGRKNRMKTSARCRWWWLRWRIEQQEHSFYSRLWKNSDASPRQMGQVRFDCNRQNGRALATVFDQ